MVLEGWSGERIMLNCSIAQSGASVSGNWDEIWTKDQAQKHIPSLPVGLAFLFDVNVDTWRTEPVANLGGVSFSE